MFLITSTVFPQKISFKNSASKILMEFIDEREYGSIYFPFTDSYPDNVDYKLFNYLGKLVWNGQEIGTSFSAAGWTHAGINTITSSVEDKVGIGLAYAPEAKLHVNGSVIIGTSGVRFSEIYELVGTTADSGTVNKTITLPEGYHEGNTRVLSTEIQKYYGGWISAGFSDGYISIHCELLGDNVKIWYPPNIVVHGARPLRLLLMKLE